MTSLSESSLKARLSEFAVPYLGGGWCAANSLQAIDLKPDSIKLIFRFGFPWQTRQAPWRDELTQFLAPLIGNTPITIDIQTQIEPHVGQRGLKGLPAIKNIIAIASGKGGVGKSTVAVNLAIALAQEGARVGILDADIYGPSQPLMLGASLPPGAKEEKVLRPIQSYGIQSMSIGYLVDKNAAMIWRGPMVSTALQQLLNDTQWDSLDYLFLDLPPGTGDIQLTMSQKIPVSGAVVVTTPQDLALLDARRAYEMFQKVNIPVLGVVENMSLHVCSACGHAEAIFGEGGGQRLADEAGLPLLGQLPLDRRIREQTDRGQPTVASEPHSENANHYRDIACRVAAALARQTKDYSNRFPNIVVKHD